VKDALRTVGGHAGVASDTMRLAIVSNRLQFKSLLKIEVDADWPMRGIPQVLHLDNAAEFKSRALRSGCREYGIDLMYRPVGRPHFGGHIERLNRTLMERVRGLPGATGSSPKGRKARQSEKTAALTLREFEQWLAIEVARRYHHAAHHGLLGATPADMWRMQARSADSRQFQQRVALSCGS